MSSSKAFNFYYFYLPPSLTLIVGLYFSIHLFQNFSKDTTAITNGAFLMLGSLSGLALSCAKAVDTPLRDKNEFVLAGERLLHAAVVTLIASILKYAVLTMQDWWDIFGREWLLHTISFVFSSLSAMSFTFALVDAHKGVSTLNKILLNRSGR